MRCAEAIRASCTSVQDPGFFFFYQRLCKRKPRCFGAWEVLVFVGFFWFFPLSPKEKGGSLGELGGGLGVGLLGIGGGGAGAGGSSSSSSGSSTSSSSSSNSSSSSRSSSL